MLGQEGVGHALYSACSMLCSAPCIVFVVCAILASRPPSCPFLCMPPCVQGIASVARPLFGERGELLDGGADLNAGGVTGYVRAGDGDGNGNGVVAGGRDLCLHLMNPPCMGRRGLSAGTVTDYARVGGVGKRWGLWGRAVLPPWTSTHWRTVETPRP